jgi:hypothetical protein
VTTKVQNLKKKKSPSNCYVKAMITYEVLGPKPKLVNNRPCPVPKLWMQKIIMSKMRIDPIDGDDA